MSLDFILDQDSGLEFDKTSVFLAKTAEHSGISKVLTQTLASNA